MAAPRKSGSGKGREAEHDPINRMIGSPEPLLGYLEGALGRLLTPWVWVLVVAALALYFVYGP